MKKYFSFLQAAECLGCRRLVQRQSRRNSGLNQELFMSSSDVYSFMSRPGFLIKTLRCLRSVFVTACYPSYNHSGPQDHPIFTGLVTTVTPVTPFYDRCPLVQKRELSGATGTDSRLRFTCGKKFPVTNHIPSFLVPVHTYVHGSVHTCDAGNP